MPGDIEPLEAPSDVEPDDIDPLDEPIDPDLLERRCLVDLLDIGVEPSVELIDEPIASLEPIVDGEVPADPAAPPLEPAI